MRIHVLGSSAGGGLPQWNCRCNNCDAAREGRPWIAPRTQSSIAVTSDETGWVLINASPDIRTQLANHPAAYPNGDGPRRTRISSVILTDAQLDHTSGLLVLREGAPLAVHSTLTVRDELSSTFPILGLLEHYCGVDWHEIPLDGDPFEVADVPGLSFAAVPLPGTAPPYSPQRGHRRSGDEIGLVITDRGTGRTAFYAPALAAVGDGLSAIMAHSDCVLVDGTFWSNDEMARRNAGTKTAADMGHLPLAGEGGMLGMLQDFTRPAKYLIHVNNTNPILDERSSERAQVDTAGVRVTYDGMELEV